MKIAAVPFVLFLLGTSLLAQSTGHSDLDGITPEGLQPGAPAGSYSLSGLDTVNLYNGSANVTIPLLQIGGRGEAGYTMFARYDAHWDGVGVLNENPCAPVPCWTFSTSGWANWDYSYRPAGIGIRHLGQGSTTVYTGNAPCTVYQNTLTRVAVGFADGTEVMLVDATTGGGPQLPPAGSCGGQGFDRGTLFVATDGSAMTFITDNHVYDSTTGGTVSGDDITGTLFFRDGRRFHFGRYTIAGYNMTAIDRIQDRNGNRTTFSYGVTATGFQYAFSVTDPLGRVTRVAIGKPYSFTDDANAGCTASHPCSGVYDEISYNGAAAQPRTLTVYRRAHWYDRMSTLQAATQPSDQHLFGGYASSLTKQFVGALSRIVLPDGHSYRFRYNQYAEIVRLDLPTGGRYEFDWGNGPGTDAYDVCPANEIGKCPVIRAPSFLQPPGGYDQLFAVYRRVKERREYVNGGTSWIRRTTYDVTETASNETVAGDPLGRCGSTSNATFISGACTRVSLKEYDLQGELSTADHYFYGAVSKYQSLFPQSGWYSWWLEGKEFRTDIMQPAGTILRKHLQTWQLRATPDWWSTGIGPQPTLDSRIGGKDVIVDGGKMARKVFGYSSSDNTNNVVDLWEYDYGNNSGSQGNLLRHTHTDFLTTYNNPAAGVYLRDLVGSDKVYNGAENLVAQTDYLYDETALLDAPGILQYVSVGSLRGNRTKVKRWRNSDGAWLTTTFTYDIAGNVTSSKNPRGYPKYFSYGDCEGVYAFLTSATNEATQTTTAEHDCSLGAVTLITDPNQFQTAAFYGGVGDGGAPDALDRLSKVIRANGQQITYRYSADLTAVTTAADQDIGGPDQYTAGDQLLRSVAISDGLGRTVETRSYTSANAYISSKKDLDALGRTRKAYNPVEMTEGQSYTNTNGTIYAYDALGRVVATTYADGASETFAWSGDIVVHTDPAGKQHRQQLDSLDRLVAVTEDPFGQALVTTYGYDALDNLITVIQGAQIRSFTYNSLKQLRSATHPEVGTVVFCDNQLVSECYTYDTQPPNDTLKTKAAGGVVTTFGYDALDRIVKKTYSDGTPQVDYRFDASQVGCLYSVSNSVASTTFIGYAPGCLVTGSTQWQGNQSYSFSYGYNLASAISHEWYPSGHRVTYHYDRAGRPDRVANGELTGTSSFAANITYAPHGAIASMRLGVTSSNPGWSESWQYNSRLQPIAVNVGAGVLSLGFSYCPNAAASCVTNNGNMLRQVITRNGTTWTQNYVDGQNNAAYDAMNRLMAAQETAAGAGIPWAETYGYDRYGNRWLASYPGLPAPNAETPTAPDWYLSNNRIAAWQYSDGRGNITSMPYMQRSYSYDGENRQTSATVNGVNATYAYDGDGRRVKKTVNGVITTYVYDALGRLAAEYSNQIVSGIGTQYRHVDHLGSTRLVVNANGTPIAGGCHDFRPFGQELLAGTNGRSASCFPSAPAAGLEFTGKERDAETGLDFFAARYFSPVQGRFTSVDPSLLSINKTNPQSWNRYGYAYNNPFKYVDPSGKWPTEIHNAILAGAFSMGLSRSQLRSLQAGSFSVDFSVLGQLSALRAHEHGMRSADDTAEQAQVKTDIFTFEHELLASEASITAGYVDNTALRELGKALHPIMDGTSPAHAGQVYAGIPSSPARGSLGLLLDALGVWQHRKTEANITLELYHKSIDKVRTEFLKTFGQEAFFKATRCKQVEECPYDDTKLTEHLLAR